jgi:hypothetical protein
MAKEYQMICSTFIKLWKNFKHVVLFLAGLKLLPVLIGLISTYRNLKLFSEFA